MALSKTFQRPTGATGNYWRIVNIIFGRPNMLLKTVGVSVTFALYQSKADFQAGKTSMGDHRQIDMTVALNQIAGNINQQAKTLRTQDQQPGDTPFFDGAVDV